MSMKVGGGGDDNGNLQNASTLTSSYNYYEQRIQFVT